jgi:hypothetical protein
MLAFAVYEFTSFMVKREILLLDTWPPLYTAAETRLQEFENSFCHFHSLIQALYQVDMSNFNL